jgi:uncharacterized repeat protein (TIGR03803 family)
MQGKGLSIALKALAIFAVTLLVTSSWAGTNWSAKALHIFGGADGAHPTSGLVIDAAGNLYGTTYHGGTYGVGTVFELSPTQGGGWTEAVLHSFNNNGVDGYYPNGGLIFDAAGNLYGTLLNGPDYGSVFKMSPNEGGGWTETVLYSFPGFGDGRYPQGSLVFDAAGNLYGTTSPSGRV